MNMYTVNVAGAWRRYHPKEVPKGWRILGTIEHQHDHSMGALGRSPDGLYAVIRGDKVYMLDQRAVADALRRVKVAATWISW